jgi:uncharacterized integral membrane protein (TIGR00697 family)
MLDNLIIDLVAWMQATLSGEVLSLVMFLFSLLFMMAFLRLGKSGLVGYVVIGIVLSNVQVLYLAKFSYLDEPIALGTVIFTSIFLANDIINEHFGIESVKKTIWISFLGQVFVTFMMVLTLGHKGYDDPEALQSQQAISVIFTPTLRILVASLCAYVSGQWIDMIIFHKLKILTKGKKLWLRCQISMLFSGLIDNIVFSVIAWVILNPQPISYKVLLVTYIGSSQFFRVMQIFLSVPAMYVSYRVLGKKYV